MHTNFISLMYKGSFKLDSHMVELAMSSPLVQCSQPYKNIFYLAKIGIIFIFNNMRYDLGSLNSSKTLNISAIEVEFLFHNFPFLTVF